MDAVNIVRALNLLHVIPIHHEGWSYFRETKEKTDRVFTEAGIADIIQWLSLGKPADIAL